MNGRWTLGGLAATAVLLLGTVALGQTPPISPDSGEKRELPGRLMPPPIDTDQAVAAAMKKYDKDKDGKLDEEELKKAPELRVARKRLDRNGDGAVEAAEIAARIEAWKASQLGLMAIACQVRHEGQPLSGAKVVWAPAPWLGKAYKAAEGTTDERGMANITVPKAPLPGAPPGFYRVRITHPDVKLPDEFNKKTILGGEVAVDVDEFAETGRMLFDLQPEGVDGPAMGEAQDDSRSP
ncbi:MAG: hypothetical protein JW809_04090 [Pirellulales bacterium]|nr:hypothetical protein [Pirellulales bacterium]